MVTKRYSPFQNSMMDIKLTDSFAKWSKMFPMISPPQKKRRAVILLDEPSNKQDQLKKRLYRRAIYIPPSDTLDGPQKWSLYRATQHKLRRNSLPLLESIHLQKMLVTLLDDEYVRAMQISIDTNAARRKQCQEDEDDIPLGTLIHKKANHKHIASFPIRFA